MSIFKDSLKTIILSALTLLLVGIAYAWTEPGQSPPAGNTATPVTTNGGQIVEGGLVLGNSSVINGLIVRNGNVGIGTASPEAKLNVDGGAIWIGSSPGGSARLEFDATGNIASFKAARNGAIETQLAFWTQAPTGVFDERVRVTGTGNVGIGTTAPGSYKLNVAGEIKGDRFVGYGAGGVASNSAVGASALFSNTTGNSNTANGSSALLYNTTGSQNTANGASALYSNTTGTFNTANGSSALLSNTTGFYNTANGMGALRSNTTGAYNTANGMYALLYNTTGNFNTANGINALPSNTTGNYNTANGAYALDFNTTGSYNTANGMYALRFNTTGSYNTANGTNALYSNTTGISNTANGMNALYSNTTGSFNTALGNGADVSTGNLTNATAIGNNARVNASNKIVLGDTSATTVGGYGAWTNYSDARLKENIYYKNDLGLDFIADLKTASFNYKEDVNKVRRDGLIAQDVQATLEKLGVKWSGLVVDDDEQKTLNISYGSLTIPLINSIKELKAENDKLKSDNDDLRLRIENLEAKIK